MKREEKIENEDRENRKWKGREEWIKVGEEMKDEKMWEKSKGIGGIDGREDEREKEIIKDRDNGKEGEGRNGGKDKRKKKIEEDRILRNEIY